jgi:predicted transcriptional regulator
MMHRTKESIIADILSGAHEPVNQTALMYSARMSHRQLFSYVRLLDELGLIQSTGEGNLVITQKGRLYLQNYKAISDIMT